MAQVNLGAKAFIASTDLEAYRRVKLSTGGGKVEYAMSGEKGIGVTAARAAAGESVTVELNSTGRTFKLAAATAIGAAADFYGANDGRIKATAAGSVLGKVLEAAGGEAEIVEVLFA